MLRVVIKMVGTWLGFCKQCAECRGVFIFRNPSMFNVALCPAQGHFSSELR